ncbi:hypothetical protein ACNKHT_16650 [Shigella flexneri]
MGYLQEKEKQATEAAMQLAQDYRRYRYGVGQGEISFSLVSFPVVIKLFTHSPSLLFSRKGSEEKQN